MPEMAPTARPSQKAREAIPQPPFIMRFGKSSEIESRLK